MYSVINWHFSSRNNSFSSWLGRFQSWHFPPLRLPICSQKDAALHCILCADPVTVRPSYPVPCISAVLLYFAPFPYQLAWLPILYWESHVQYCSLNVATSSYFILVVFALTPYTQSPLPGGTGLSTGSLVAPSACSPPKALQSSRLHYKNMYPFYSLLGRNHCQH